MKKYILIIAVLIGIIIAGYIYTNNKIQSLNSKVDIEVNLRNALTDTINTYKNKRDELVSEKLTIQATVKELQDKNLTLTKNQKELVARVKETDKSKSIIAAALIEQKVVIDSLGLVLLNKQFVSFNWNKDKTKPISFSISNSNPYFTTTNIDSYAIPELQKELIKPTFWQKIGKGIKNGGSTGIKIGIGVGVGYLIFK